MPEKKPKSGLITDIRVINMAEMFDNTIKKDRVLLAAVDTGSYDVELSLDELEELTETAGGEVIARVTQKRPSFDSGTHRLRQA